MNGLNYNVFICSVVFILFWECFFQIVEVQLYFNVLQVLFVFEGIVFDWNNNLLFVDVVMGCVFKLILEWQFFIVFKENLFGVFGLVVYKDGWIFIVLVGDMQCGFIWVIEFNGICEQMIVVFDIGFFVNDLVFDNQGGFYFIDSWGNLVDLQGGVFYVSFNVGLIYVILSGFVVGNGIVIDFVGFQIWVIEYVKNRFYCVRLLDIIMVVLFGLVVIYQFIGLVLDGVCVDSEGNVYVVILGQGCVMVFNCNGLFIG